MEWLTLNPLICVGWLVVGAVAGMIARSMMKSTGAPLIQDIILGLAGSVIGGFVAGLLGMGPGGTGGIERVIINLVISVVGAVIILFIGKNVLRR
jgi:uncharacterized membrane protein YeaQ/YmgE (transglycosylase-associated protein family)